MYKLVFGFIIFVGANSTVEERTSKFIPWPGWTRFENNFCVSNNGLYGTCYTRRVCRIIKGQASGRCATSTVGSCCIVQQTCEGTAEYNNTYFVNPNYPRTNSDTLTCTITIIPCEDACQIRLDFLTLSLAQPDANGYCVTDALTVLGGGSFVPIICGENSNQHVYVGVSGNQTIALTIQTNAAVTFNRKWRIRIAHIGCSCPTLAPPGCLMYYTTRTGTVNSFNFGTTASGSIKPGSLTRPGTRELANLNYGVCIDMIPGFCSIQWSQNPGNIYSFTVSNDTMLQVQTMPGLAEKGANCTDDYVVIPNADPAVDRFCGNAFDTKITSSKPFVLTVVTNGGESAIDIANRGFSLNYRQLPCPINLV